MNLEGMTALVTGGAKGIGLATAKRLLAHGCSVVICDCDIKSLRDAAAELKEFKERILAKRCDVTDTKQIHSLAGDIRKKFGTIDILINNAGVVIAGNFHEVSDEKHCMVLDVNVASIIHITREFLQDMYEKNFGVVVNISSAAGVLGVPGQAVYSASKWAVWGFTESMRHEAENLKKNVHFASVHPGYLAKGMFEGAKIRGLGGVIVPLVKDHDVVARAIVDKAIIRKKTTVFCPGTVRIAVFLRGILPDRIFYHLVRMLNIHSSMNSFRGRGEKK